MHESDNALFEVSPFISSYTCDARLQALVYDILPSTTAIFSYTVGSRKLSAIEQFFVGAQTAVSLLQTTQIMSDIYLITDYGAYAGSNKTKNRLNQDGLRLFFNLESLCLMFTCVLGC